MRKRIIVACGGAVATSTVAANKIAELCEREGIDSEFIQCRVSEINSNKYGADLIVTTARVKKDYGVPLVNGMAFISGVGVELTEDKILSYLKNR
ncbi:MAG: PTS galactitol transporter subunit IIB [Tissierellia bacterium]|nr:PTS galactitol transporter subunit IIB [Tissierellia bacterium]